MGWTLSKFMKEPLGIHFNDFYLADN